MRKETRLVAQHVKDGGGATSQTLSRGIRILEALAARGTAASTLELAAELGLHRSVTYRLVRTLEEHRLVVRDARGQFELGPRLASLAATVERDLQQAALPALRAAATELGATCFLVQHDGDEAITLTSVQPPRTLVTIAQHPGTQHPLGIGAPGRAVLSLLPREDWPAALSAQQRDEVEAITADGYAYSRDEVIPGLQAVAVPLQLPGHAALALGVAYLALEETPGKIAARLQQAAAELRAAVSH